MVQFLNKQRCNGYNSENKPLDSNAEHLLCATFQVSDYTGKGTLSKLHFLVKYLSMHYFHLY